MKSENCSEEINPWEAVLPSLWILVHHHINNPISFRCRPPSESPSVSFCWMLCKGPMTRSQSEPKNRRSVLQLTLDRQACRRHRGEGKAPASEEGLETALLIPSTPETPRQHTRSPILMQPPPLGLLSFSPATPSPVS